MEFTLNSSPACAVDLADEPAALVAQLLAELVRGTRGRCGRRRLPSRASTRTSGSSIRSYRSTSSRAASASSSASASRSTIDGAALRVFDRRRRRRGRACPRRWSGDVQLDREVAQREIFERVLPLGPGSRRYAITAVSWRERRAGRRASPCISSLARCATSGGLVVARRARRAPRATAGAASSSAST